MITSYVEMPVGENPWSSQHTNLAEATAMYVLLTEKPIRGARIAVCVFAAMWVPLLIWLMLGF